MYQYLKNLKKTVCLFAVASLLVPGIGFAAVAGRMWIASAVLI
ncbi:MAG: hypothetical protein R2941_14825 [Desulfobacterales bacterium]